MMKSALLTASLFALFSGVTYADTDTSSTYCKSGFYAGLQGGRGDTFYHGDNVFKQVQTNGAGTASNGTKYSNTLTSQNVDDIGLAGRLYAGYQFTPYLALETGYTQWNKTDFSANVNNRAVSSTGTVTNSYSQVSGDITEHAVDLSAKATLPIEGGFGVYAKAGMSYIESSRYINGYIPASSNNPQTMSTVYTKDYQAFRPNYGGGIDYTIPNSNVDVEVFYNEIAGSGAIKTASLWGAGVAYKFA